MLGCLNRRLKWYQEAAEVKSGKKPLETGKEYPPQSIKYCEGAAAELKNTIDVVRCWQRDRLILSYQELHQPRPRFVYQQ